MKACLHLILPALGLLLPGLKLDAAPRPDTRQEDVQLAKQVVTLFQDRCVKCHGSEKPKAGLALASIEQLARGSRNGPVVQPGKPEESLLWQMVADDRMPPRHPLVQTERALLRRWIERQAPGLPATQTAATGGHWAYRLLVRPTVPQVRQRERLRTGIDAFIEAALEHKGLTLRAEADRETLLRRVRFDLTGLPPTPAERDAFLTDASPNAYERMVERTLASPHYGERWGKFWLESAGYADSNGYFSADSDRPLAYHYRDYVIRSLNADKPYDRFVAEQLCGDEMAGYRPDGGVTPAVAELLTATHFLRNAPDGTGESDGNPDEVRTDRLSVLEGNLQITMSCLLGLTIQCARCHAHKFEPIRHEEYYQLQAIFSPVYCPERWVVPNQRTVEIVSQVRRQEFQERREQIDRQIKALQMSLASIAAPFRDQLVSERLGPLEPSQRARLLEALKTDKDKRTPEQRALLKAHAQAVNVSEVDLAKRFPDYQAVRAQIAKAVVGREKERPPALEKRAVIVEADPKPLAHHVLLRGQHNAPGPEVQPGVPLALCLGGNSYHLEPRPAGRTSSGRRTAFARWVTSPANPLFARVLVNRVWQHHFGRGIVATSDNLGQSGARPSHPELLDYLATEFIHSGWSLKALHRQILLSGVYRQSGAGGEDASAADPDNHLLSRFPLRRLDAEAVRDGMLAVSGELDTRLGGPYVPTHRLAEGNVEVEDNSPGARRRSVYLQQRRTQVATLLELFDAPAVVGNCTYRNTSTLPSQSLALLNSTFARARARAFAARLEREAGSGEVERIQLAFRLAQGRNPTADERNAARRFLAAQTALYASRQDPSRQAWADLCQMVFASNAFLYVE
jgi:hypothetical protein